LDSLTPRSNCPIFAVGLEPCIDNQNVKNGHNQYEKQCENAQSVMREYLAAGFIPSLAIDIWPNDGLAQVGKQSGCFPCHGVKISRVAK
jgi:hypothetical protein